MAAHADMALPDKSVAKRKGGRRLLLLGVVLAVIAAAGGITGVVLASSGGRSKSYEDGKQWAQSYPPLAGGLKGTDICNTTTFEATPSTQRTGDNERDWITGCLAGITVTDAMPTDAMPTDSLPARTVNDDCALESAVLVDTLMNDGPDVTPVYQAVGYENSVLLNVVDAAGLVAVAQTNQLQQGTSYAETQLAQDATTACQQAGNPLLTQGQVSSLQQVATASDAAGLDEVVNFPVGGN